MGGFSVVLTGFDEFKAKLETLKDTTKFKQAVLVTALKIESDAKESIQHSTAGGRTYRHHGIAHTASVGGEPPATDTGTLVSSIQHWVSEDGLNISVGSKLEYAGYLEFGTRNIYERPFIIPALDTNIATLEGNVKKALASS